MKKILIVISILIVIDFIFSGCAARQLTPEELKISSVSDTSNCKFIKADNFYASPQTLDYWLKVYTHDAGGSAYKIINSATDYYLLGGIKGLYVNFEVYKCKSDSK